jgi:ornithine carbamoyltransferase
VVVDVRVNTVGFYSDQFPMTNHDFPHPCRFLWDGLATAKRHVNSLQLSKTCIVNCGDMRLNR